MTTYTSERGLEDLICLSMTGQAVVEHLPVSGTPNSARLEHDKALARIMLSLLKDDTEAYKQFAEDESFRRFVSDLVFTMTSEPNLSGELRSSE